MGTIAALRKKGNVSLASVERPASGRTVESLYRSPAGNAGRCGQRSFYKCIEFGGEPVASTEVPDLVICPSGRRDNNEREKSRYANADEKAC